MTIRQALDDHIHSRIADLCAAGDKLAQAGKYDMAIATYQQAWDLLPEPKENWESAGWILAAIGDAYFLSERHTLAEQTFGRAITSCGGLGNPFLHMRRGQSLFELGLKDAAADELMRAYMAGGRAVFADENPRYLEFLSTRAIL